ncbi:MAG: cytochrome ubiquinol oxidase subunit I [Candidatus Nitrospinota bacterium M3_3B_026]
MRDYIMRKPAAALLAVPALVAVSASAAFAAEGDYHQILGLSSRKVIWFIAQLHLFFGAFVLGVPIFAAVIEYAGYRSRDAKLDALAYEFTSLLSVAYATTAAIGGLLIFAFVGLYPAFFGFMADIFKDAMFIYALLFFGETFCLYIYYYGWKWMSDTSPWPKSVSYPFYAIGAVFIIAGVLFLFGAIGHEHYSGSLRAFWMVVTVVAGLSFFLVKSKKGLHICIGVWLNVFGTLIMMVANSWAAYMMSPSGIDPETGKFVGTTLEAVTNPLWIPVGIHRMLGNVAFGGFVAGAYAAVKFIGAKTPEEKAHYDWMGYIANFVGISGLIPLPFAGYYLGREVYSNSAVMGNNMMGGDFSWTFIMQAMLVGSLFLISCYYLWTGMGRIPGAERYRGFVKYLNSFILISFAIWLTPHNLPLTGAEVSDMGGSQYHPTLKFLGLMPAKNAVVNLIIISTFASFLLYRRGNKGERIPISAQGRAPMVVISVAALLCLFIVGQYVVYLFGLDPKELDLPADREGYFHTVAWLLTITMVMIAAVAVMAIRDKGIIAQYMYLGWIIFSVVIFLGVYGFVVMEKASPFLRNVAVAQFIQLISAIILVTTVDIFLFAGAKTVGELRWGQISVRAQYALLTLCIFITFNMGLMGFIRSGLRTNWHVYGVLKDTSDWAFTPTNYTMTIMVSAATLVFLAAVAFMFWLAAIAKSGGGKSAESAAGAKLDPIAGGQHG